MHIYYTARFTIRDCIKGHNLETAARANDHKKTQLDNNTPTDCSLYWQSRAAPRQKMVRSMADILLTAAGTDTGMDRVEKYTTRTPIVETRFSRRYGN